MRRHAELTSERTWTGSLGSGPCCDPPHSLTGALDWRDWRDLAPHELCSALIGRPSITRDMLTVGRLSVYEWPAGDSTQLSVHCASSTSRCFFLP